MVPKRRCKSVAHPVVARKNPKRECNIFSDVESIQQVEEKIAKPAPKPSQVTSTTELVDNTNEVSTDATGVLSVVSFNSSTNNGESDTDDQLWEEVHLYNDGNFELPTGDQLSRILCHVNTSAAGEVQVLKKITQWAETENAEFLTLFHRKFGVVNVINFLKMVLNDNTNIVGASLLFSNIEWASRAIESVCYNGGEDKVIYDIAKKITTTAIEFDGMDMLTSVSKKCTCSVNASKHVAKRRNDSVLLSKQRALAAVWATLANMSELISTHDTSERRVTNEAVNKVLNAGVDVIIQVTSVETYRNMEIRMNALHTLKELVVRGYVEREHIEKCDVVFKIVGFFQNRIEKVESKLSETALEMAIRLFSWCHMKDLLDGNDFHRLLPLCISSLKQYAQSNMKIRERAVDLIHGACLTMTDSTMIEEAGAMEVLGEMLAMNAVGQCEKDCIRSVIVHMFGKLNS